MASDETALSCLLALSCECGDLMVHAVRGREVLSTPFRYEIDFSTDGHGHERLISGVVDELEVTGGAQDWLRCRIVVVPYPALLRHTRGSRIFQAQSIPEIVETLFGDHKIKSERIRQD